MFNITVSESRSTPQYEETPMRIVLETADGEPVHTADIDPPGDEDELTQIIQFGARLFLFDVTDGTGAAIYTETVPLILDVPETLTGDRP